jgi:hypothetical protein
LFGKGSGGEPEETDNKTVVRLVPEQLPGEKLETNRGDLGGGKSSLQSSGTARYTIPPKQPINVLVAPTANQLIAVLAANPSMRTKFVAAIFASLIVTRPEAGLP